MSWLSYIYILAITILEVWGDFSLRFFADAGKWYTLVQGIVAYGGIVGFLVAVFKQRNVLYVNALWDGGSAIVESLAAYLILGDRFTHWFNYVGLALIVVGLFLTAWRD